MRSIRSTIGTQAIRPALATRPPACPGHGQGGKRSARTGRRSVSRDVCRRFAQA
jgi:hypothetical protein